MSISSSSSSAVRSYGSDTSPKDSSAVDPANPLGLRKAASEQFHGSLVVVLGLTFLLAGFFASVFLKGNSDEKSVAGIQSAPITRSQENLWQAELLISNRGNRMVSAHCRITVLNASQAIVTSKNVVVPNIPANSSMTYVLEFETEAQPVTTETTC